MTTARTSRRSLASAAAARISSCTCALSAFMGGRSSRIVATAPSTSSVTKSAMRRSLAKRRHGPDCPTMSELTEPSWPGSPTPLGATWDGEGTNFALWAPAAESVDLCLFEDSATGSASTGSAPVEHRVGLEEVTYHVWHGYLPRVGPG